MRLANFGNHCLTVFVIFFLERRFQISALFVNISIMVKYFNWLNGLQDSIIFSGFFGELFVTVMLVLPPMGVFLIMGFLIKYVAKYAKKLLQRNYCKESPNYHTR